MGGVLLRSARLVGTAGEPLDLLVEDCIITAIGAAIVPGAARVVEVGGRWVSPGLWDSHVHMDQWALMRQRLDLAPATSAAAAASFVRERLRSSPPEPGQPLVGYGFQDGLWPDAPTAELLDAISADVPVVLVSKDLHAAWLNTRALAQHGAADHPTGLLREQAAFDVNTRISAVPDEQLDRWVAAAVEAAAARGVVGVVDLEMTLSIDRWAHRVAAGTRGLRVRTGVYPQDLDAVIARGLRTGDVIEGTDGLVTMGPFKIITDGSLNTRTAFCHDPYPGLEREDGRGISTVNGPELTDYLRRASSAGLVPAVHAIGDAANSLALDAFEAVGCGGSIEHAQLVHADDVGRFARLGVTASVQPEHAMDDRDVADRYWHGRTHRAFAFASLVAAGATITLGSDAPVAPLDPWVSMAAAVSRARDGRDAWHPEQRLLASVALAASTDGRTTLRTGSLADLVISELNPLDADDARLRDMRVSATMLGGRWTHFTLDEDGGTISA
ncbi:amidohydrolase family protein [Vibrio cholerae]|nr:amidohydrolase family protein [Vibrio cholerae]